MEESGEIGELGQGRQQSREWVSRWESQGARDKEACQGPGQGLQVSSASDRGPTTGQRNPSGDDDGDDG